MNTILFVGRRILISIPLLILISMVCFAIIQLPPGDYASNYAALVAATGGGLASPAYIEMVRERYGLDKPVWVQYWRWIKGFPRGDFGIAMSIQATPVVTLLKDRLPMTIFLNMLAYSFALLLAIPIGLYSATHKYTTADYILTFFAFIGISIPGFIIAIAIIGVSVFWLGGTYLGHLYSSQFIGQPWTLAKIVDFLRHLPPPILAIGIASISNTMRIMRANTIDILGAPFVQTARAKGLSERFVLWKHVARLSVNPIVSRVGVYLPEILATEMMVSIVLNLETIGPLFYQALISQDMYLAGTILLVIGALVMIGNMIADIVLALLDPRIREGLK